MFKAAFILAASAAMLGLATLSLAQESTDDQFMAVGDSANWYLQRSTCTLAHSVNGQSAAVVRLRISMGVDLEFVDPALRGVRVTETAPFVVTVDGVSEEGFGMGIAEEGRDGYRLGVSHEMLDRIIIGRRLEARSGGRTLLRLDLAGAAPAIDAMRTCHQAFLDSLPPVEDGMAMNAIDAAENAADAARNGVAPQG